MASEIRQCRKQKQPIASPSMEEVSALCFQGHALNDVPNHVTVDRDLLPNLLVEKQCAKRLK